LQKELAAVQDPSTEKQTLGNCIIQPDVAIPPLRYLPLDVYHSLRNRKIFNRLLTMYENGEPIDLVTLIAALRENGELDFPEAYVSGLIDDCPLAQSERIGEWGKILLKPWRLRRARTLFEKGLELVQNNGHDISEALMDAQAELDELTADPDFSQGKAFSIGSVTAADLQHRKVEKPKTLVGDFLTVAALAILYGAPGTFKTWLCLLLAVCMTTTGRTFFGFCTSQCVAGYISFELPLAYVQERLTVLLGDTPWPTDLHISAKPDLRGLLSILEPSAYKELKAWIEKNHIKVVFLDALSRIHEGDETFEGLGAVLRQCDRLREETGCCVFLLHHERKATGGKSGDDDMAAIRGTSRLASDPTVLMRVKQHRGVYAVRFVKCSLSATPEPFYFRQSESGGIERVNEPASASEAKAENIERVKELLNECGRVTAERIAEELEVTKRTAERYLKEIGAKASGHGSNAFWSLE
jgi:hypothetical protein